MDTIQSVIERFTYYNEETGYSVAKLEKGIVAVGMFPGVNPTTTLIEIMIHVQVFSSYVKGKPCNYFFEPA